jgi:hypothetical protein
MIIWKRKRSWWFENESISLTEALLPETYFHTFGEESKVSWLIQLSLRAAMSAKLRQKIKRWKKAWTSRIFHISPFLYKSTKGALSLVIIMHSPSDVRLLKIAHTYYDNNRLSLIRLKNP